MLSPRTLVAGPFVALSVRIRGGGVVAQESVAGPVGLATTPCSPYTSTRWYFAGGATVPGDSLELALFNPTVTPAVLDMRFATLEGLSAPPDLQGVSVPPGGLVVEDVGTYVPQQKVVATRVTAEVGHVVADELELRSNGGPGMALTLGTPTPATACRFPVATVGPGIRVAFDVFNPSSRPSSVQVSMELAQGTASPFVFVVPAQSLYSLDASKASRLPSGTLFATTVASTNGVPLVVERSVSVSSPFPASSYDDTEGSCAASRSWAIADPPPLPHQFVVAIQDARDVPARVTVEELKGGRARVVPSMAHLVALPGVPLTITVPPAIVNLAVPLVVVASVPVFVEQDGAEPGTGGLMASAAVPLLSRPAPWPAER